MLMKKKTTQKKLSDINRVGEFKKIMLDHRTESVTCGNCGMPVRCVTAILKRPVLGWDWTSIIRTISAVPCH